jgi:aminoglycoside phosphotransferase (APT) family kinase protein
VGGVLRCLHDQSVTLRWPAGSLPVDPLRRADPWQRLAIADRFLARLRDAGVWEPDHRLVRLRRRARGVASVPPAALVLVHGDLHPRHVLVDPRGAVSGVVDWGDACRADPAVDLASAYLLVEGSARDALLREAGYPDGLDPSAEVRARALAVCLAASLGAHALAEGDQPRLTGAVAALERALA